METFPKTLFFEVAHRFGGSGTRLINLIKNLPKDRVALACLSASETANALRPLGYKIYEVGKNKFDPLIPFRVARVLSEGEFEILDTQNIQSKIWGSIVVKLKPLAFVSTVNSAYMKEYGDNIKGKLYHQLDMLTNRDLNKMIAVSAEVQHMLVDAGIDFNQISLIQNSIDINTDEVEEDPIGVRKTFEFPEGAIVGAAIGRLEWVKGFEVLIAAINLLLNKTDNFYCLIVGDGPQRSALVHLAVELGVTDHISFAGFQPLSTVYRVMRSTDMVIMPSYSEGTPMALLEAAILNSAIVASNVGGIPDILSDGKEALLVQPGDVEQLAEGILALCGNSPLRDQLGAAAHKKVREKFAPNTQVLALKKAYEDAIKHFSYRNQSIDQGQQNSSTERSHEEKNS